MAFDCEGCVSDLGSISIGWLSHLSVSWSNYLSSSRTIDFIIATVGPEIAALETISIVPKVRVGT